MPEAGAGVLLVIGSISFESKFDRVYDRICGLQASRSSRRVGRSVWFREKDEWKLEGKRAVNLYLSSRLFPGPRPWHSHKTTLRTIGSI